MGHKHTREDLLAGALAASFDDGLSQLTFGRLAKRLGVSDRIIVYYFPTKDHLVSEVLLAMGGELQSTLGDAIADRAEDHRELVRQAWPVLAQAEVDPVFALFFEANGLAAAGRQPYASVVPQMVAAWVEWIKSILKGPPSRRQAEAEATVAMVDGLLLVRQLLGSEAADRAARRLGVR